MSVENIMKSRLLKKLVQILVILLSPKDNFVNLILLIFYSLGNEGLLSKH